MKKTVIVVTENNWSKDYVKFAVELADDLGMNLKIFDVHPPAVYTTGEAMLSSAVYQATLDPDVVGAPNRRGLISYLGKFKSHEDVVDSAIVVSAIGIASDVLNKEIEDNHNVGAILLCRRAQESLWSMRQDNIDIIKSVKAPILLISEKTKYHEFKRVIYLSDYNENDLKTIRRLRDFLVDRIEAIEVLHISNEASHLEKMKNIGFTEMVSDEFEESNISLKLITTDKGHGVEALEKEVKHFKASLLVVLKEDKRFIDRVLNKSFTKGLVNDTELPLLVYHIQ